MGLKKLFFREDLVYLYVQIFVFYFNCNMYTTNATISALITPDMSLFSEISIQNFINNPFFWPVFISFILGVLLGIKMESVKSDD